MENELELKDMVNREVHYCASTLIHELGKDEKYQDEILEFSTRYEDPEDNEDLEDPIEALEHWIVSDWLAHRLEAKGEMIGWDFLGLTIWGRACSGQQIICDSVIQDIYNEMMER